MTTLNLADVATGVPEFGTGKKGYAEYTLAPDASGFDLIAGGEIIDSIPIHAVELIISKRDGTESLGIFVCAKGGLKPKTMYMGEGGKLEINTGKQLIMLLIEDIGICAHIAKENPDIDMSKSKIIKAKMEA